MLLVLGEDLVFNLLMYSFKSSILITTLVNVLNKVTLMGLFVIIYQNKHNQTSQQIIQQFLYFYYRELYVPLKLNISQLKVNYQQLYEKFNIFNFIFFEENLSSDLQHCYFRSKILATGEVLKTCTR